MRIRVVVVIVVAVLAIPGVAHAKGPSSATISGDGLTMPVTVDGDDVMNLRDEAGYFAALFGQTPDPIMATAPTDDLGPVLTITWFEGTRMSLRQQLYPFASTGPLVFTDTGQDAYVGWYRAQPAISALLTRLGVPDRARLVRAAAPARAVAPSTPSSVADWSWPTAAVTVPLTAALLAMVVSGWRRRARVAPA